MPRGHYCITGGLDLFHTTQKTQYRTVVNDIRRLCSEKKYDVIHVNTGVVKFQAVVLLIGYIMRRAAEDCPFT